MPGAKRPASRNAKAVNERKRDISDDSNTHFRHRQPGLRLRPPRDSPTHRRGQAIRSANLREEVTHLAELRVAVVHQRAAIHAVQFGQPLA